MRKKLRNGRRSAGRGRKTLPALRSHCPISYALDFVGDKWTLIVLRDLCLARKRHFQQFLESDEKIASNILAARLKLFENAGLVTRDTDPDHGRRVVYTPTEKALDLMPVLLELLRWGTKYHAKANAPAHIVKGASENRDKLIAELRSLHAR
jgi:DNA-binding HxlR family transcriptional regulator